MWKRVSNPGPEPTGVPELVKILYPEAPEPAITALPSLERCTQPPALLSKRAPDDMKKLLSPTEVSHPPASVPAMEKCSCDLARPVVLLEMSRTPSRASSRLSNSPYRN